jgi:hypothetical protein
MQFESKNSACFQKAVIKLGRRRMRFKRAHRMIAERHKRLRTEVGKLMLLSVPPQVFHWIELGCISRQILKLNLAVLAKHKVFDQSAAMAFEPIPDYQHVLGDVTHQMREKLNDLRVTDTARVKPK